MIAHALEIIKKELQANLNLYQNSNGGFVVELANVANYVPSNGPQAMDVLITLVNIKEERTLKNLPNFVRDDVRVKVKYENPPTFLNMVLLFSVVKPVYAVAVNGLSRVIRFFQFKNVFTQENVLPETLNFIPDDDQLETFKLIFDLHSPSMEEVNHLWGTLGGKQYPFVMYTVRMLDLQFRKAPPTDGKLILTIQNQLVHKEVES
jgi:hypothetical protein